MRWVALVVGLATAPVSSAPLPSPRPTIWHADLRDDGGEPTFTISNDGPPRLMIICKPSRRADVMYRPIRGLDGVNGLTPIGYVLNSDPRTPHMGIWYAQDGNVIPYDPDIAPALIRRLMQVQKVAFFISKNGGEIDHGWVFDVTGIATHRGAILRHCRLNH